MEANMKVRELINLASELSIRLLIDESGMSRDIKFLL